MKIVIIGGGTSGSTAAFELKKLNKDIKVTILEKTSITKYSPCALPYVIEGKLSFDEITVFTEEDYKNADIFLNLNTTVELIDTKNKSITYNKDNTSNTIDYDKLIIATGSKAFIPPIKGIKSDSENPEKQNYLTFTNMKEAKVLFSQLDSFKSVVIIGAGFIGLELAWSLKEKGKSVSVYEMQDQILSGFLDKDMAGIVEEYLSSNKITINTSKKVSDMSELKDFDKVIISAGIEPDIKFTGASSLNTNKGIIVDTKMQTSNKDIFALGDCIEIKSESGKNTIPWLATSAVRQAKIAAHNILGEKEKYSTNQTAISRMGDLFIGSTGIKEGTSAKYKGDSKTDGYPGNHELYVKITADKEGIVIGGQVLGNEEVAGRLNLISLAIQKKLTLQDLSEMDTCYNPASAPMHDPVSVAASICLKKLKR